MATLPRRRAFASVLQDASSVLLESGHFEAAGADVTTWGLHQAHWCHRCTPEPADVRNRTSSDALPAMAALENPRELDMYPKTRDEFRVRTSAKAARPRW